ncbi:MAG: hypothetical protein WD872_17835 [Pirellulaceae bacterium]
MKNSTTLFLLAAALCLGSGCNRAFYRRQADRAAYDLVSEKSNHPHWAIDDFTIAVDPRSRMFDPYAADCPPMPPDDPTAHELMHCVDNKRGWPFWHDNGDTPHVENAAWPAYLEMNAQGQVVLGEEDAVRVALLNSPDYQQNLEELYLSALDVSFERFRFDVQGFAGYEVFYTADGRIRGGGESRSTLEANTFSRGRRDIALQRLFTTGGDLVVGFANSLVWQLSGPDDYSANTLIDFALFQPLLRNAGRDRVLERLTVSERGLLSNVRAMEQYRQGFYLEITTGRDAGAGPNRRGGVIGSGLEGFTGVGGGGFGGLGGGGAGFAAGGGAAQAGGYLGLLQDQQQIRNAEDNVDRQRSNLIRLEEFLVELRTRSGEVGLVSQILTQDLQVAQARQALLSAESDLITSRNSYQATLDTFKSTLGLPPQLCLEVSDDLLDQFQLIDRATVEQQRIVERIVSDFGEVRLRIVSHVRTETLPDPADPTRSRVVRVLEWYPELEQDLAELKARIAPLREVRESLLTQYLPTIEADLTRFEEAMPRRKEWLANLRGTLEEERNDPCPLLPVPDINEEVFRAGRLDESLQYARSQFDALAGKIEGDYEAHLNRREGRIDQIIAEGRTWTPERLFAELYVGVLYPKQATEPGAETLTDILAVLPADVLALQLLQARARSEAIELSAIEIEAERALEVARKYRRDWMNARAALVDSWRLIQFNADQLQSTLDVFFSGDIGNADSNNPFSLNSDTGRLRVGVQFDAPLTRVAERNTYRQSLIEYQQARRSYYNFEDNVARALRSELRTILANQINFELQRQAVLIAAQQIDRNEDIRINSELSNQGAGVTAARDSVSALSDLLTAQNGFLGIWVNYEVLRRGLDLDLGTMQLDSEGLWIDPGRIGEDYGQYDPWLWKTGGAECPLPIPHEVTPAEVLPNHPGHQAEEVPPGEPMPAHLDAMPPAANGLPRMHGLPRIEGLPRQPAGEAPLPAPVEISLP